MKKFLSICLSLLFALGVWFGIKYPAPTAMPKVLTPAEVANQITTAVQGLTVQPVANQQLAGASIPVVVSLFETSLATKITPTANSMTLVSGVDSVGTTLSGYMCFTLDEGSSTAEFVCGTTSGTSVTSMIRGISPITGTSTVASLRFEHRRGASVKITNYPQLAILSRVLNGDETLPNPLKYDSSISTTTIAASSGNLASVGYVNTVALQGGPTATTIIPGVVQIGTTAQIAAGTGMTGAYTLVPAGSLFSQAWRSAITVPVTNATGTLATGFIDQSANYTWSGSQTFNGPVNGIMKSGGTGADGALTITSGVTTIDCAGAAVCVKNYTSISITGTGQLKFTNTAANGTTVILKSQTSVTITSSANPTIDLRGVGANGGAGSNATASGATAAGTAGISGLDYGLTSLTSAKNGGGGGATASSGQSGGGGGGAGASAAGAAGGSNGGATGGGGGAIWNDTNKFFINSSLYTGGVYLSVGSGGGGGSGSQGSGGDTGTSNGAAGGTITTPTPTASGDVSAHLYTVSGGGGGGAGGGALYVECGGALNFGASSTINASGSNGSNSGASTSNNGGTGTASSGGAGGGGSAGTVVILYKTLTANAGTITVNAGSGGSYGAATGGSGNYHGGNGGAGSAGLYVVGQLP